jgi:hypothetical protein
MPRCNRVDGLNEIRRKLIELQSLPYRGLVKDVIRFGVEPSEVGIEESIWLNTWRRGLARQTMSTLILEFDALFDSQNLPDRGRRIDSSLSQLWQLTCVDC